MSGKIVILLVFYLVSLCSSTYVGFSHSSTSSILLSPGEYIWKYEEVSNINLELRGEIGKEAKISCEGNDQNSVNQVKILKINNGAKVVISNIIFENCLYHQAFHLIGGSLSLFNVTFHSWYRIAEIKNSTLLVDGMNAKEVAFESLLDSKQYLFTNDYSSTSTFRRLRVEGSGTLLMLEGGQAILEDIHITNSSQPVFLQEGTSTLTVDNFEYIESEQSLIKVEGEEVEVESFEDLEDSWRKTISIFKNGKIEKVEEDIISALFSTVIVENIKIIETDGDFLDFENVNCSAKNIKIYDYKSNFIDGNGYSYIDISNFISSGSSDDSVFELNDNSQILVNNASISNSKFAIFESLGEGTIIQISNSKIFENDLVLTLYGGEVTFQYTNFVSNKAISSSNYCFVVNDSEGPSSLSFKNCTISQSISNAATFFFNGKEVEINFENTIIENSISSFGPSIMYIQSHSSVTLKNCEIRDGVSNQSPNPCIESGFNSKITATDSKFVGCRSTHNGAVMVLDSNSIVEITNCEFYDNRAGRFGGVILSSSNRVDLTIINSIFKNNSADESGSVVYFDTDDGTAYFEKCIFEDNKATEGVVSISGNAKVVFSSCQFIKNHALIAAGCISGSRNSEITVLDSNFTGCNSIDMGGAIFLHENAKMKVERSLFKECESEKGGIFFLSDFASLLVNNSYFFSNKARESGGVLLMQEESNTTVSLFGSFFTQNFAQHKGGSLFVVPIRENQVTINNCTFEKNRSRMGGAIFSKNIRFTPRIQLTTFLNNFANVTGNDLLTPPSQFKISCSSCSMMKMKSGELLPDFIIELYDNYNQFIASSEEFGQYSISMTIIEKSDSNILPFYPNTTSYLSGKTEKRFENGKAVFSGIRPGFSSTRQHIITFKIDELNFEQIVEVGVEECPENNFIQNNLFCVECKTGSISGGQNSLDCIDTREQSFQEHGDPLGLAMVILAIVMIVISVITFIILFIKKEHKVVKASSPIFCYIIILGIIIGITTVFALTGKPTAYSCMARPWLLCIGFSLVYSNLLAKTWRVYRIFSVKDLRVMKIGINELLFWIGLMLIPELILLSIWTGVDPLKPKSYEDPSYFWTTCSSTSGILENAMTWTLFSYNAFLATIGLLLAFKTRNVYSSFRESKQIGLCIYNIFVTCSIVVPIVSVKGSPTSKYVIYCVGIMIAFGFTLVTLFFSKIYLILTDAKEDNQKLSDKHESTFFLERFINRIDRIIRGSTKDGSKTSTEMSPHSLSKTVITVDHENQI